VFTVWYELNFYIFGRTHRLISSSYEAQLVLEAETDGVTDCLLHSDLDLDRQ
jgi:hypothetical protein